MKIACMMMQKNEDLLLEPWIRYHANLFGIRNLYVFDNGSTSDVAREVLARFEGQGLQVNRQFDTPGDFDRKGQIVTDAIIKFRQEGSYEAVFPLDCDEFVAVESDSGISCRRDHILAYLETLQGSTTVSQIAYCLDNRPGFLDLFRLVPFQKALVPVDTFVDIDHGFHQPKTSEGEGATSSKLRLIHMHFKPFDLIKAHAREKLAPFVDVDNPAAVAAFTGVGRHLVGYFAMTCDEYYSDMGLYEYPLVSFTGFLDELSKLMPVDALIREWCVKPAWLNRHTVGRDVVEMPGHYFGPSYLEANPDVACSSIDPTTHYCLFGYREKRNLHI